MDSPEKNLLPIFPEDLNEQPKGLLSLGCVLSVVRRIKLCYPNLAVPPQEDQEGLQFFLKTWWSFCRELTNEQFLAAAEHHLKGENGKWPLTPATLWTAHRELKEIEEANRPRPIMPRRSW